MAKLEEGPRSLPGERGMQGPLGGGTGPGLSPVDRRTLLICTFILAVAWGQMNFTG